MGDTLVRSELVPPNPCKSTSTPSSPVKKTTQSVSTKLRMSSETKALTVRQKIAKPNADQKTIKKAAKAARKARKAKEQKLKEWCEQFSRASQMEGRHRFGSDEMGVIICTDAKGDIACPVSVMQYLIDNKKLHATEGDSALKCFYEDQYDRISTFPEHLERFAAVIRQGAQLARDAQIGDVKAGDYDEDAETDSDDSGDDK